MVEYIVDAEGRRIAKKVDGVIERKWLYRDSLKPIAEIDALGNMVAVYGYGEKYTTPSFVERDEQRYRVISDHLGSQRLVVHAADPENRPVVAEYAAFGEVNGIGLEWMPFGFAGGIYDADTGLVRFGARDFDPVAGRWTAKDPILFGGRTANLYEYAANCPTMFVDPTGEIVPILAAFGVGFGIGMTIEAITMSNADVAAPATHGLGMLISRGLVGGTISALTSGLGGYAAAGATAAKLPMLPYRAGQGILFLNGQLVSGTVATPLAHEFTPPLPSDDRSAVCDEPNDGS